MSKREQAEVFRVEQEKAEHEARMRYGVPARSAWAGIENMDEEEYLDMVEHLDACREGVMV